MISPTCGWPTHFEDNNSLSPELVIGWPNTIGNWIRVHNLFIIICGATLDIRNTDSSAFGRMSLENIRQSGNPYDHADKGSIRNTSLPSVWMRTVRDGQRLQVLADGDASSSDTPQRGPSTDNEPYCRASSRNGVTSTITDGGCGGGRAMTGSCEDCDGPLYTLGYRSSGKGVVNVKLLYCPVCGKDIPIHGVHTVNKPFRKSKHDAPST